MEVFSRATSRLELMNPDGVTSAIFFENTDYDFYMDRRAGTAQLVMPPGAAFRYQNAALAHHAMNFGNDVGIVEISIVGAGNPVRLTLEVFPLKVDYRTDYVKMRDEVASISRSLALGIYARTFATGMPIASRDPTLVEWISLLRHFFHRLVATANAIAANPHSTLATFTEQTTWRKARRVHDRKSERRLRRPSRQARDGDSPPGLRLPEHAPERKRFTSYDNAENRYIKYLLTETVRKLQAITLAESTGDEDAESSAEQRFFEALKPEAAEMARRLRQVLLAPFLGNVAPEVPKERLSSVFNSHPHYSAFTRLARLLNCGLSLEGGPLRIGVKHIAQLYEYWCFLKLVKLLAENFELEQQSVVQLRHLKMVVVLAKGKEAAVQYIDRSTGRHLMLVYNRMFRRLPTVAQKPDNVIQLASDERLYVLDAKYRLSYDTDYLRQYGGAGPTVEDINTMHRYRDAIVVPVPMDKEFKRGVVQGSAVLFPFLDEEGYRNHRFYKSLAEVQIGGLPFLPGSTGLVEDHLGRILQEERFVWSRDSSDGRQPHS